MAGKTGSPAAALVRMRWAKPDADRDQPRRAGKLGGRPKKLKICTKCGATGGTAEMRTHRCALIA
jgi:hypothetical protein